MPYTDTSKVNRIHIEQLRNNDFDGTFGEAEAAPIGNMLGEGLAGDDGKIKQLAQRASPEVKKGHGKIQSSRTELFFPNSKGKLEETNYAEL